MVKEKSSTTEFRADLDSNKELDTQHSGSGVDHAFVVRRNLPGITVSARSQTSRIVLSLTTSSSEWRAHVPESR